MSLSIDPVVALITSFAGDHPADKPIVLAVEAEWCGWCKKYKASGIFHDANMQSNVPFREIFISFNNAPKAKELRGKEFASTFDIKGFPTIIGFRTLHDAPVAFDGDRNSLADLLLFAQSLL